MVHQKIEQLIPYISENFITYPLWEEGKYIPFINFWQRIESQEEFEVLHNKMLQIIPKSGYDVEYDIDSPGNTIHHFYIYPKFKDRKDGSYKFKKKDWSIEEMLDLLVIILK